MTPTAVLFPGQGSLTPDAASFARSHRPDLVALAEELLGRDPFSAAATSTAYAQPAIFAASIAGWEAQRAELDDVCAMAGHSLGELSALAAAGALAVEDALRLVVVRGQLMERAAADAGGDGGMLALLGGSADEAHALASEYGLVVANDNAPGQLVLSGPRVAVDNLAAAARSHGFKALALDVAGAFHSPAVAAACEPFYDALREVDWSAPTVPVVSGLTAAPFSDPARELADALTAPVQWRAVMRTLDGLGAREYVDVGPGRVLAKLVARNLPAKEQHALAG